MVETWGPHHASRSVLLAAGTAVLVPPWCNHALGAEWENSPEQGPVKMFFTESAFHRIMGWFGLGWKGL